ncbi:hypothetical protein J7E25_11880 [Agromyces sp. ISL-38]|uniref:hypothetical protein n=1 Tax=Agromyces sp. ISL-38 TaxID=2819107 RepID=UPI001BE86E69|nr:hypothetical protein [Agromyces sp. ISL-38]MBT2499794.1 hypothetical protein [Agromyces sp. ISL-38]
MTTLRNRARILDVVESTIREDSTLDPAARNGQLATVAEARALDRLVDGIRTRSALPSGPLPAELADLDGEARARVDALASRHRITPTAALALLRSGQRAAQAARQNGAATRA